MLFFNWKVQILFIISPQRQSGYSLEVPLSTYNIFSLRNKKNNMWIASLICSYSTKTFHFKKANTANMKASFKNVNLSIMIWSLLNLWQKEWLQIWHCKLFGFWMVMFHTTSYCVYISQFLHFTIASSQISDLNDGNNLVTDKLLKMT